jgi:hypothetical protein
VVVLTSLSFDLVFRWSLRLFCFEGTISFLFLLYLPGQNSQPKWACKTRHFGYGIDFFPPNLKSCHRLHRDRSKGIPNPNGRVKREKSGGKSHEMKAKSTRPFGLVIAKNLTSFSVSTKFQQQYQRPIFSHFSRRDIQ